jgi:hypothetical protein
MPDLEPLPGLRALGYVPSTSFTAPVNLKNYPGLINSRPNRDGRKAVQQINKELIRERNLGELMESALLRKKIINAVHKELEALTAEPTQRQLPEKYNWIYEYLSIEGNTPSELARLLVDKTFDTPWVLRPDYIPSLSHFLEKHISVLGRKVSSHNVAVMAPNTQETTIPSHEVATSPIDKRPGMEENSVDFSMDGSHSSPGADAKEIAVDLQPDLMLGVAGFIPLATQESDIDPFLQQELWLQDITRHLNLTDNGEISVSYSSSNLRIHSKRFCHEYTKENTKEIFEVLAERILIATATLENACSRIQHLKICSQSLPILVKQKNTAEVFEVNLEDIFDLVQCIRQFVRSLKLHQEFGTMTLDSFIRLPDSRKFSNITILNICLFLFIFLNIPLVVITMMCVAVYNYVKRIRLLQVEIEGKSDQLCNALRGILRQLDRREIINSLPEDLSFPADSYSKPIQSRFSVTIERSWETHLLDTNAPASDPRSADFMLFQLHSTALCVQILCLTIQSLRQEHTGALQFSFIDHDVSKVQLLGAGYGSTSVIAFLKQLTCFGEMTKEPVLVFQLGERDASTISNEVPCDLISTLDNIGQIWGNGQLQQISSQSTRKPIERAFLLGGGILHPTNPANEPPSLWHWTPQGDVHLHKILKSLENSMPQSEATSLKEKIHIGFYPRINEKCPMTQALSTNEGRRTLGIILQDKLDALESYAPHWDLDVLQGGFQGGQWVVPQLMVGWKKVPGRTLKHGILDPNNKLILPALSQLLGLEICLCSGAIWRVSLSRVIGSCIEQYVAARINTTTETRVWEGLKRTHRIVNALNKENLSQWFKNLPDDYQSFSIAIIMEILNRLQHTGIDHQDKLRICWAEAGQGFKCLKIPCTKSNSWVKILADSPETVTFACVTSACLKDPDGTPPCGNEMLSRFDAMRPLLLHTQVRPKGEDYNFKETGKEWTLRDGMSYWIGSDSFLLLARLNTKRGIPSLRAKRSIIPSTILRRSHSRVVLRETNDPGSVSCIVLSEEVS